MPGRRQSSSRLDARLAEALAAATRGDRDAASAALEAYAERGRDDRRGRMRSIPALAAQVESALEHHVAVLTAVAEGLAAKGNDTAAAAVGENIDRAIAHSAAVLDTLASRRRQPRPGHRRGSGSRRRDAERWRERRRRRAGAGGAGPAETPRGNGGGGGGGAGGAAVEPHADDGPDR